MEPIHDSPPDTESHCAGAALIVQTGRRSGTRRAPNPTLTLIGRSAHCDIRLSADGVSATHCALVCGPDGLLLRDLESETGTFLNGERVSSLRLTDGDQLVVGPFQFQVCLPRTNTDAAPPVPAKAQGEDVPRDEKEALRIQAAAVVAQQAALTEEELRLQQQHVTLKRQEEQLAAHLEEKRRRLLELQKQVQDARLALRQEREAHERNGGEARRQVIRTREEAALALRKTQAEHRRLIELRKRLRKRSKKQWEAVQAEMQRREEAVTARQQALEKENERLQQERAAMLQDQQRRNGEIEIGKRQLGTAWDRLHKEQKRWKEDRSREAKELKQLRRTLEHRDWTLTTAERELDEQKQRWENTRLAMEKEVEGLENRVRNYRRIDSGPRTTDASDRGSRPHPHPPPRGGGRVSVGVAAPPDSSAAPAHTEVPAAEQNTNLEATPPAAVSSPPEPGDDLHPRRLAALERLASELADQRAHLAEQCERLAHAQQEWQQDRNAAGRRAGNSRPPPY